MVAAGCLPQVQACAVRVAELQTTGQPATGAGKMYVSDTMVNVTISPQYEDGEAITDKNACGTTVTSFVSPPTFIRADITVEFIESNPDLAQLMLTQGTILSGAWGKGWAYPPLGALTGQFSLELWAKRINNGVVDPTFPYAKWAIPLIKNTKLGDREFNGPSHMIVTGEAYENTMWFDGPNNDWPAASNRVAQWIPVATLPTANCTAGTVATS